MLEFLMLVDLILASIAQVCLKLVLGQLIVFLHVLVQDIVKLGVYVIE